MRQILIPQLQAQTLHTFFSGTDSGPSSKREDVNHSDPVTTPDKSQDETPPTPVDGSELKQSTSLVNHSICESKESLILAGTDSGSAVKPQLYVQQLAHDADAENTNVIESDDIRHSG